MEILITLASLIVGVVIGNIMYHRTISNLVTSNLPFMMDNKLYTAIPYRPGLRNRPAEKRDEIIDNLNGICDSIQCPECCFQNTDKGSWYNCDIARMWFEDTEE